MCDISVAADPGSSSGWPPTTWWPACCWCTDCTRTTCSGGSSDALDGVRPYLGSHGGDVHLLEVAGRRCRAAAVRRQLQELSVVGGDAGARRRGRRPGRRAGDLVDRSRCRRSRLRAPTVIPAESLLAGCIRTAQPDMAAQPGIRCPIWPTWPPARSAGSWSRAPPCWPAGSATNCSPTATAAACDGSLAGAALHRPLASPIGAAVLRCPRCRAHFDVVHAGAGLDDDAELPPRPDPAAASATACCRWRSPAEPTGAAGMTTPPTTCWPGSGQPARARAGRRAVRDVLRADRRRASARGECRRPAADVHVPRLLSVVHRHRTPSCATARSRIGIWRSPISRWTAASGRRCRSRSAWRSSSATRRSDRTVAFYPGPAGATESELDLDAWNAISGADPRVGHAGRRRRGAAGPGARRSEAMPQPRMLSGADRRLLRVRRPPAHAVAGFRRRPGGARSSSTTSSRRSRRAPGARPR